LSVLCAIYVVLNPTKIESRAMMIFRRRRMMKRVTTLVMLPHRNRGQIVGGEWFRADAAATQHSNGQCGHAL